VAGNPEKTRKGGIVKTTQIECQTAARYNVINRFQCDLENIGPKKKTGRRQ